MLFSEIPAHDALNVHLLTKDFCLEERALFHKFHLVVNRFVGSKFVSATLGNKNYQNNNMQHHKKTEETTKTIVLGHLQR